MTRSNRNPWLHRFAVCTAVSTFGLIAIGGLVTSHGAGLAVPDWPTSYGYNMFLFPPAHWIGVSGVFYEHSHRLFASFVGLLTAILAVWLWIKEERRWLRWCGVGAFFAVVFQGVLGGLRVTLFKDEIGIFHAALAQSFLVFVCFIAFATSKWWLCLSEAGGAFEVSRSTRMLVLASVGLVFLQLILGATMRHQHAGLAVPDFPLAWGKLWPPMDAAFIESINRERIDSRDFNNITAFQIALHMTHRIGAVLTLAAVAAFAWTVGRASVHQERLLKWSVAWLGLIVAQATLGVVTVLSNKAADAATAHVVLGAASLVFGALLAVYVWHFAVVAPASGRTRFRVRADGEAISDIRAAARPL